MSKNCQQSYEFLEQDLSIRLRPRKNKSYNAEYFSQSTDDDQEEFILMKKKKSKKILKKIKKNKKNKNSENFSQNSNSQLLNDKVLYEEIEASEKLPQNQLQLQKLSQQVKLKIKQYNQKFFQEQFEIKNMKSQISDQSIPICTDILQFNFTKLITSQKQYSNKLFDAIMMDPPWQLSSSQPSRGVAIAYDSLSDDQIKTMPINKLSDEGFLFVWVINAKYRIACQMIEFWGYKLIDEITWVKKTVNGKIAKGHGFYLQHAKESCLIGVKGNYEQLIQNNVVKDVIFSARRGQSQKPQEIYEYIETLIPQGNYLEIFGRRNNLRDGWVTIGNEL